MMPRKEISIEEVKRRLFTRFGIEEDDLKSSKITDDAGVRKLYADLIDASTKMGEDDVPKEKSEVKDNYKLTKDEEAVLKDYEIKKKKRVQLKKATDKQVAEVGKKIKKAEFEQLQESLPAESRVSFDEAQQAIKELGAMNFDDEDEEEDKD